ncbi:MAG: helix-turn-helix transcriptional regulator, partial [Lachnospiraceae bacterium]|nr:helix-turn-helix transcriptional regulator [Lachnospiraceae bacterium]
DILVKAVRKYCNCLSMIHQNVCYCYLLANALMEAGTFQEWIKSWLPGLLNSMEDRFEAEAKVGISSFQDSYFDMYKAVDEADIALQNEITGRITFYECESRTVAENIFSGKPTFLSQYLKEGKTEQALERLGQILRENGCVQKVDFATCFYTVELLVNTALLLDIDKRRVGMRWTMQECLRKLYEENIWPKASMADAHVSFTQFETWLHRMLDELQEDLKRPIRKSNLYVEKALIYVERNYMRDISLESVADSIGITQFYLSRLFKQERNQTFLEALTDIRISRSIRLLLDPTRSVSNVSMMTGYNLKYFYQVFKNATGMSQRKFREGMFRIEE